MSRPSVLRCSLAVVGFMIAATALGAERTHSRMTSATPGNSAPARATDGLICRNRLRPGSHIASRACLTAGQWAASYPQVYGHEGPGSWGMVSTTAESVGMNVFTAR
jgi:hypothetical protein